MSVRGALLAILTLGPAYGLQVRDELIARAPHRHTINVGQIYGTLDRLGAAGLVRSAGLTEDGLPLYELTTGGREAARLWRTRAEEPGAPDWPDMLDQLLVTASLPGSAPDVRDLLDSYRRAWDSPAPAEPEGPAAAFLREARRLRAASAREWLESAGPELASGRAVERAPRPERPRRGRRGRD